MAAHCEGPELLRALYKAVSKVTVLDPACGSGAFLFAALNILEPLYEACLDRMRAFTDDLERSGEPHSPRKFEDFRRILAEVEHHPNRTYFILKSIVVHNLYGVDLMEEAAEICKLRLFLKLVAQVDDVSDLEPLPDIDFNIRAGNTLVGYATRKDVRAAIGGQSSLDFDDDLQRIEEKAGDIDRLFEHFSLQQTSLGGTVTREDKRKLRALQNQLGADLNKYLSERYRVRDRREFKKWLASHKPFHWFVEFHRIITRGGFDVIVGNPPYVEYRTTNYVVQDFRTLPSGDIYALITERAYEILVRGGRIGFIVPISIFGVDGFSTLQDVTLANLDSIWVSFYANRPAQLFEGAQKRLTILLGKGGVSDAKKTGFGLRCGSSQPRLGVTDHVFRASRLNNSSFHLLVPALRFFHPQAFDLGLGECFEAVQELAGQSGAAGRIQFEHFGFEFFERHGCAPSFCLRSL